jgi:hypothetical protein
MMAWIERLSWRPEIGDPSVIGWITVVAYAVATMCCASAARRVDRASPGAVADRKKWMMVAAVMASLCVNKQLDLQSLLTDLARVLARHQGWYEERREVQKVVLLTVLAVSCGGFTAVILWFRRFWAQNLMLLIGLVILLFFVAERAISFHHLDQLLRTQFIGVNMNWFLELSAIALITAAAVREARRTGNAGR